MDDVTSVDFHSQLTSLMEALAQRAVVEINRLFEDSSLLLRLEISRCTRENEALQRKCRHLETELQCVSSVKIMDKTEAPLTHSGLTDTGHQPMNMWRQQESNVCQHENKHLVSTVNTIEATSTLDEKPDMIRIKEEMFEDCCVGNPTEEGLTGLVVGSSESSADFITYTIPSDDPVESNSQQTRAEGQTHDGDPHEDTTPEAQFNTTQNQACITEEKRLVCAFCGRTCTKLSSLKAHMRIHSGEKPFACTVCGKQFAQKTYLRIHQRIHSGERPYTCVDCGKGFAQKSALNVHLRSHTGEKPYSCVECGKSYKYKQDFNSHPCFRLMHSAVNDTEFQFST